MKDVLNPSNYSYSKTSVSFRTDDEKLQALFDKAEAALSNILIFFKISEKRR